MSWLVKLLVYISVDIVHEHWQKVAKYLDDWFTVWVIHHPRGQMFVSPSLTSTFKVTHVRKRTAPLLCVLILPLSVFGGLVISTWPTFNSLNQQLQPNHAPGAKASSHKKYLLVRLPDLGFGQLCDLFVFSPRFSPGRCTLPLWLLPVQPRAEDATPEDGATLQKRHGCCQVSGGWSESGASHLPRWTISSVAIQPLPLFYNPDHSPPYHTSLLLR